MCARFQGFRGHCGFASVNGNQSIGELRDNRPDDREDALFLFLGIHRLGAGAGGFAADIEDICSRGEEAAGQTLTTPCPHSSFHFQWILGGAEEGRRPSPEKLSGVMFKIPIT